MYLRHLQLKNLKRIRNLTLDFTQPDGSPQWSVILGPNAAIDPARDQIINLDVEPTTGEVVYTPAMGDPRLMSGTQLYARYFDLKQTYAGPEGKMLYRYLYLATNPYRNDAEEREVNRLARSLSRARITLPLTPVVSRRKP